MSSYLVLALQLTVMSPAVAPERTSPAPPPEGGEGTGTSAAPAPTHPSGHAVASADAPARRVDLRAPMPPLGPQLAPPLAPQRDRGMFQAGELAAASGGALLGDAAVIGAAYGTLRLFANGTIPVTATHMRNAAYALGVSAIVVPPLLASAFAAWTRHGPGDGAWWKSFLLATAGQVAAIAAGWALAPAFWVVLPVQLAAIPIAASAGLHWGPARGADAPGVTATAARPARELTRAFMTSPPACPAG